MASNWQNATCIPSAPGARFGKYDRDICTGKFSPMEKRKRKISDVVLSGISPGTTGLLSPDFEDEAHTQWRDRIAAEFNAFATDKLKGIRSTAHESGHRRLTPLPTIYWLLPVDEQKARVLLVEILEGIVTFIRTHKESVDMGDIQVAIVAENEQTGLVTEVNFRGPVGEVKLIQVRDFWPPAPSIFTTAGLFTAFALPLFLASVHILRFRHETEIMADFFAYILPVIAALAGGVALFYERWQTQSFWASAGVLGVGVCSYLMAKHVDKRLPVAFALLLVFVLLLMAIIDEFWFARRRGAKSKAFGYALLAAGAVVLPSTLYLYMDIRHDPAPAQCQVKLSAPTTMQVITTAAQKNQITYGGSSREWSLNPGALITLTPCPE